MQSTICPDQARMDDDGAPPVILPIRPADPIPVILPFRAGPAQPPAPPLILNALGEPADEISWPKYLAWRKTKCRPYDYVSGPRIARTIGEPLWLSKEEAVEHRARGLEEIDQAIHEFVGEVAELGELIANAGPTVYYEHRDKLIDEIGDILFCGVWVMDAWGKNPLNDLKEDDNVEMIDMSEMEHMAILNHVIKEHSFEEIKGHHIFLNALANHTTSLYIAASIQAGLLCNSYKKLRFQRREQDVAQQIARVFGVFMVVAQILGVADAGIKDAMRVNMRKLDARFPHGYQPGVGGGIRTGEGK